MTTSDETSTFEIVIVGAGPAGLSTWLHLHDRDPALAARSVVIEKARHPREKICGGGVAWPGDRQLEFLDVHVDVPSVPIHDVVFRFGEGRLTLPSDHAIRIVRRREFDHALAQAAIDRGLDLREGVALERIQTTEDHVDVQTSRGRFRARMVVGADGAQSRVRAQAGFEPGAGISRLLKVVTDPGPDDARRDCVVFDFSRIIDGLQGYVWHFPCLENGRPAMDRGIFDSRVRPERARVDLRSEFSEALATAGVEPTPNAWQSHPVRPFSPEVRLARPRTLLVGDAAGIDPILGEGISQSLRHGDVAADALVDAFEGQDFSMASYADAFAAHELGRSLHLRHRLARDLYAYGADQSDQMQRRLSAWIAGGLP